MPGRSPDGSHVMRDDDSGSDSDSDSDTTPTPRSFLGRHPNFVIGSLFAGLVIMLLVLQTQCR
jgi:hypothetical protein